MNSPITNFQKVKPANEIVVVLDNIRSIHNVGSILRTCDIFGIGTIYCCGITPYLPEANDERLPHIQQKVLTQITKTSLGAEKNVKSLHVDTTKNAILQLMATHYTIYALEQAKDSVPIEGFSPKLPCALILGNEVNGISDESLKMCDSVLEIAQFGKKESLNVSVATGIALYELSH